MSLTLLVSIISQDCLSMNTFKLAILMLLYSVLCIFSVQLNLTGESKADKAETLEEDKGDETILIVQNARPTGETVSPHGFSKKHDLEWDLLGKGIEKSHQKSPRFSNSYMEFAIPSAQMFCLQNIKDIFQIQMSAGESTCSLNLKVPISSVNIWQG